MKLAGYEVGIDRPLFLIAGPCVVESEALVQEVAGTLKELTTALDVPLIFKLADADLPSGGPVARNSEIEIQS